jgi:hypothetical protein
LHSSTEIHRENMADELFDLPDDYRPATDTYWSDALEKAGVAWATTRMQ